jgi:hypothetical protein
MNKPAQIQPANYNGHAYKIIFERANLQHPEGSKIAVFLDDPDSKLEVWVHTALLHEHDDDLSRQAHKKAEEHANANFPK